MTLPAELQQYIPLEKSWMIRMGMLDLQNGRDTSITYLSTHQKELGDDLLALLKVLKQWGTQVPLEVGESGTLYRFIQYLCWLQNSKQQIIARGTLLTRKLASNPEILGYSVNDLLKLDGGTSQWASAACLFTDVVIPDSRLPYHLTMSLEAKKHWHDTSGKWVPRLDQTIVRQAEAYYDWKQTGIIKFTPVQSEDFLFAVAFELMTVEAGARRWPQLVNHETDRIAEISRLLDAPIIDSPDHRVVQALAMRYPEREVTEQSKKAVNKTWPKFWQFLSHTTARI